MDENPFEKLDSFSLNLEYDEVFYKKMVTPFYTVRLVNKTHFKSDYFKIREEVDFELVKRLLGEAGWRERIVGGFFCAIEGFTGLEDIIGVHMLKSEMVYQGRGFTLAFASLCSEKSVEYLKKYLDYYLTRKDLQYDQSYAMCALEWIDKKTQSNHADDYQVKFAEWEMGSFRKVNFYDKEFANEMSIIEDLKKN